MADISKVRWDYNRVTSLERCLGVSDMVGHFPSCSLALYKKLFVTSVRECYLVHLEL